MWIEDTAICDECGSEVTCYTDGREAYAVTGSTGHRMQAGGHETNMIWRDGHLLRVWCPARDRVYGERCGGEVVFTGEGTSARMDVSEWAEPILTEAP